jgi:hypothetical protein
LGHQEEAGSLVAIVALMKLDTGDGSWSPADHGMGEQRGFPRQARGQLVRAAAPPKGRTRQLRAGAAVWDRRYPQAPRRDVALVRRLLTGIFLTMLKRIYHSCSEAIHDESLFRSAIIHDSIPGLADRVEDEDWAACARLLGDTMRSKPHPSFSPFCAPADELLEPEQLSAADGILDGIFTLPDSCGGTITERLIGDFEWSPSFAGQEVYHPPKMFRYSLNQHEPLATLAQVFWHTGDTRYRDRLIELLLDWIRRVPTYWELLHGGEVVRQHWQNMNTRNRFEKWLHIIPLVASALSDRDAVDLLKAMIFHADLMNRYVDQHIGGPASATLSGMMKVNLKFAILVPEAAESDTCVDTFKRHFRAGIDAVFYPDGGLKYRCPGYHAAVARWYVEAVQLAEDLKIEEIGYERRMADKMEAFTALIAKPDGSLPLLGDTGTAANEAAWRQRLALLKPETPSARLEWSGLYAMRSGWEDDALYLFLTAGPYGTMHNHQDHLSFEVSGYGTHLIVEPGITPYGRTEQRQVWGASPAHNTLVVDGLGQHRHHVEPTAPSPNPWYSCPEFDFVQGRFDEGFGPEQSVAVVHVRSILFIKSEYFLIVDQVLGDGSHALAWHFMFYPTSMQIDLARNRAVSDEPEGPNVSFTWSDSDLHPELVAGEAAFPYRGLMTGDRPAPSLFLRRTGELPLATAFLVEPIRAGAASVLALEQMDATDGLAFRVQRDDGRDDRILLGQGGASSGGLVSDGLVTILRGEHSRPVAALVAGASSVMLNGERIQDCSLPLRWL